MKETTKEIGKQLLEILKLIVFIPAGFLVRTIVKFFFASFSEDIKINVWFKG